MPKKQSAPPPIDRDKLRAALRGLGDEYVFNMFEEAIDLMPAAKLVKIIGRYMDLKQLRPDGPGKANLLAEVRTFDASSRTGKYYQSFNVNSKNYMEKSGGTQSFIADCRRLLDRCVARAPKGDAAEIREAIEIILDLLRYIDEANDDVIFFADEAGAWQVGIDWAKVLPALFTCLSRTTEPEEYARRVVAVVQEFAPHDSARQLAAARRLGTAAHRKALRGLEVGSR